MALKIPDFHLDTADKFYRDVERARKIKSETVRYDREKIWEIEQHAFHMYGRYLVAGDVEGYTNYLSRDLYDYALVRGMEWQRKHGKEASK